MTFNPVRQFFQYPVPFQQNQLFQTHFKFVFLNYTITNNIFQFFFSFDFKIIKVVKYEETEGLEISKGLIQQQFFVKNQDNNMTVFMNPESLIFYGFTVKEIDRCPTVFSIQTHISCHICLCESVENSLLTRLICGHIFHSMCLIEWAFQRGRCGCIFGCLE